MSISSYLMKMPANCGMPDTVVVLISNIQKKYFFNKIEGSSKSVKDVHCFKIAGYIRTIAHKVAHVVWVISWAWRSSWGMTYLLRCGVAHGGVA